MFRSVSISRFRGFKNLKVEGLNRFNLILGKNNVGKTAFLEALYLLVGPTNPELPLRISAFRGIEVFRAEPEELWGWLFYEKRLDSRIELEAAISTGRKRSLEIILEKPKSLRLPASRKKQGPKKRPVTATTTEASPPDLVIKYISENNERATTRAYLKESTIAFDRDHRFRLPTSIFMSSRGGYSPENVERYSKLEETGRQQELLPAIQLLEPRLKRLAILVTGSGSMIHGDIGIDRLVPVPLMGEGIGRLLTLLLAIISCKDGVLLVDEIETGLHYSVMAKVWTAVAQAARSQNVQVVATTHSWECLRSAHESFSLSEPYDFRLHRLDRSDDSTGSVTYDRDMISMALKSGMEMR